MCYLVVERYSVCRCLYYQHSVDMCSAYGTKNHPIQERTPRITSPLVSSSPQMKRIVFDNWVFMAIVNSGALRV
ncbi:hypothetical protein BDZ45DRAFT_590482 [Acephala macrosclerotiorum]|nr:hypothetical protein BDZ45DRAFT_590482 [Acephala macrosclerotiorum]